MSSNLNSFFVVRSSIPILVSVCFRPTTEHNTDEANRPCLIKPVNDICAAQKYVKQPLAIRLFDGQQ